MSSNSKTATLATDTAHMAKARLAQESRVRNHTTECPPASGTHVPAATGQMTVIQLAIRQASNL